MRNAAFCLLLTTFGARAAEPPPPPPAASGSWTVRVHLVTDDQRVELRRFADHAFVCKAPCGVEVPVQRGEQFRLEGQGLNPSEPGRVRANQR